ncbi:7tm 6 domain containing protein [Asbolus verrucosus]|uniref:7tm 6 domain containing protein n=1 Tax=Asbolus verrucosus TaxID=1661398 RepID=A0A482VHQ2_ASBVE|nr:7tm 6 domain containing protein [Asbolus verrucosus]
MQCPVNLLEAFRYNILILKITAVWSFSGEFWYKIYKYVVTCGVSLNYFTLMVYLTIHYHDSDIADRLYSLPGLTQSFIKFHLFRKNFRQINETLKMLQMHTCQPRTDAQKEILDDSIHDANFFVKLYATVTAFLVGTYVLRPLFAEGKQLPTLAWMPFDYQQPIVYEIIFTYVSICTLYLACVNVATDSFICISMMQIGSQCDLICDTLRNIYAISKTNSKSEHGDNAIRKILIECINHYNLILRYANLLADAYKEMVMAQFVCSLISICSTMYQLSVVNPLSPQFFQLVCFQSGATCEIFFYCFFGNLIIEKVGIFEIFVDNRLTDNL